MDTLDILFSTSDTCGGFILEKSDLSRSAQKLTMMLCFSIKSIIVKYLKAPNKYKPVPMVRLGRNLTVYEKSFVRRCCAREKWLYEPRNGRKGKEEGKKEKPSIPQDND